MDRIANKIFKLRVISTDDKKSTNSLRLIESNYEQSEALFLTHIKTS